MPFPRKLLADHEEIVFDLKPHWVALVKTALWTVVFLAVAIAAFVFLDGTVPLIIAGIALVAWLFMGVGPFLQWLFTTFVLTTDRLITRSGVIAKASKEIPLERINDVAFNQGILDRMLGAGDLMIESAGERGQTHIKNVRRPEQVQLTIYKEVEKNNERMMRPGAAPAAAEAKPSIPAQIEALDRLREQGVISRQEFEEKKKELLDRL